MARFNYETEDKYGSSGQSDFFQLKEDKETAKVRFMYKGIDDVEGYSVHEVEIDGKKKYVNCLREYDDPIDMCPLCKANYKTFAKLFVPLYMEDSGEVKVWERGKKFFGQLSGLCSRYENLASHIIEIERNGKPKDTGTTYALYPISEDSTTLDDLPEVPKILGTGKLLDKTAEDMDYYSRYKTFPDGGQASEPVRREEAPARRTPARGTEVF